jgi:hypothetical protein
MPTPQGSGLAGSLENEAASLIPSP